MLLGYETSMSVAAALHRLVPVNPDSWRVSQAVAQPETLKPQRASSQYKLWRGAKTVSEDFMLLLLVEFDDMSDMPSWQGFVAQR